MTEIPESIMQAVNTLLAPYGAEYRNVKHAIGKRYLTLAELREYTGYSRSFIYERLKADELKAIQHSPTGTLRFDVEDVDRWMRKKKRK